VESSNKELKDFFEVLDFIGVDFSDELETVFDLLLEIDDFEETRCFFHPDEELVVFWRIEVCLGEFTHLLVGVAELQDVVFEIEPDEKEAGFWREDVLLLGSVHKTSVVWREGSSGRRKTEITTNLLLEVQWFLLCIVGS
jgi:hypothetical protein